ncbi:MAG: Y-family DNA polymerase [Candidatus Helarchaeota archaeon]
MNRIIFHVDMDAFYASCEITRNLGLEGKPVIIGADPKKGKGRGVVMTASYEARPFGVRSGMPISRAFQLCPEGIFLRPDMKYYRSISDKIMEILRVYADKDREAGGRREDGQKDAVKFEQWGLDEAFIEVTDSVESFSEAKKLAKRIQKQIYSQFKLTCSIGIGPNKQVAKIASDQHKPNGITIVPPDSVRAFLDPLPVDKIIGIGPKSKKILNERLNIKTIAELADFPPEKLNQIFGKMGIYLSNVARGIDNSPVRERYKRKSLGTEITFEKDVEDFKIIYKTLELLVEKLHPALVKRNLNYQIIVIKIRFTGFTTYTRQQKLKSPINDKFIAIKIGKELLKEFESNPRKVRLLGLRFAGLSQSKYIQKTLF